MNREDMERVLRDGWLKPKLRAAWAHVVKHRMEYLGVMTTLGIWVGVFWH